MCKCVSRSMPVCVSVCVNVCICMYGCTCVKVYKLTFGINVSIDKQCSILHCTMIMVAVYHANYTRNTRLSLFPYAMAISISFMLSRFSGNLQFPNGYCQ